MMDLWHSRFLVVIMAFVVCADTVLSQMATLQVRPMDEQRCCSGGRFRPMWSMLDSDGRYHLYAANGESDGSIGSGRMITVDPEGPKVRIGRVTEPAPVSLLGDVVSRWPYAGIVHEKLYHISAIRRRSGSIDGLALARTGLLTGSVDTIPIEATASGTKACLMIGNDMIVVSARQGVWLIDTSGNARRVIVNDSGYTSLDLPTFVAYADDDQITLCTIGAAGYIRSLDGGETWTRENGGPASGLLWATEDPTTNKWYGLADGSVYEIGPDLSMRQLTSTFDRTGHSAIAARSGVIVTHNIDVNGDVGSYVVRFPDQEYLIPIASTMAWGSAIIDSAGTRVHLGNGERIISLDRNGNQDTTSFDLDVDLEVAHTLRDGAILGGSVRTSELRRSADLVNWDDVDVERPIAPLLICATQTHEIVCDTAGVLWTSADTGRTFRQTHRLDSTPVRMASMRDSSIVLLYSRTLQRARGIDPVIIDDLVRSDIPFHSMAVSPSGDTVALLTQTGSILRWSPTGVQVISSKGLKSAVTSLAVDAVSQLWVATKTGAYRYEDIDSVWTAERTLYPMNDSIDLFRSMNGLLVAKSSLGDLYVRRPFDQYWAGTGVDVHTISVDATHVIGYAGPIVERSVVGPLTQLDTTQWTPLGPFERYVPLAGRRLSGVISMSDALVVTSAQQLGSNVMSGDLHRLVDQWPMAIGPKDVHVHTGNGTSITSWQSRCLRTYDVASESTVTRCDLPLNTVAFKINGSDTIVVTSTYSSQVDSSDIRVLRGLQTPLELARHRVAARVVDASRTTGLLIGGDDASDVCIVHYDDSTVTVRRTDGTSSLIDIPTSTTSFDVDVDGKHLLVTAIMDGKAVISDYDLPEMALRATRSFIGRSTITRTDLMTILDNGKHALLQGDTVRLLELPSFSVVDSVASHGTELAKPVMHRRWVVSPHEAREQILSSGPIRWLIRDNASSVSPLSAENTAWTARIVGDVVEIDDSINASTVVYRLIDLTGTVHVMKSERRLPTPSASGLYIVQRIDLTHGTSSTRRVMVIR